MADLLPEGSAGIGSEMQEVDESPEACATGGDDHIDREEETEKASENQGEGLEITKESHGEFGDVEQEETKDPEELKADDGRVEKQQGDDYSEINDNDDDVYEGCSGTINTGAEDQEEQGRDENDCSDQQEEAYAAVNEEKYDEPDDVQEMFSAQFMLSESMNRGAIDLLLEDTNDTVFGIPKTLFNKRDAGEEVKGSDAEVVEEQGDDDNYCSDQQEGAYARAIDAAKWLKEYATASQSIPSQAAEIEKDVESDKEVKSFSPEYLLMQRELDAEDDNNQPPAIPETDAQELEEERQDERSPEAIEAPSSENVQGDMVQQGDADTTNEESASEDASSEINDVAKEVVRQSILMSMATDITDHIVGSALEQIRSQDFDVESASVSINSPIVEIIDEASTEKNYCSDFDSVCSDGPNQRSVREKYEFEINKESSESIHSDDVQGLVNLDQNMASLSVPVIQAGPLNEERPTRDLPSHYVDGRERGDMVSSSIDDITSPILSSDSISPTAAVREIIPDPEISRTCDMHTTASLLTSDHPRGASASAPFKIPKFTVTFYGEDHELPIQQVLKTDDTASTNALVDSLPTCGDLSMKPHSATNDRENRTELDQVSFNKDDTQFSMSTSASSGEKSAQPLNEALLEVKSSDISMSNATSQISSEVIKIADTYAKLSCGSTQQDKDAVNHVHTDDASLVISENQTAMVNKCSLGDTSIGELQLSISHDAKSDASKAGNSRAGNASTSSCLHDSRQDHTESIHDDAVDMQDSAHETPKSNSDKLDSIQEEKVSFSDPPMYQEPESGQMKEDLERLSEEELMMAEAEAMFFDDLDGKENDEVVLQDQEAQGPVCTAPDCRTKLPMTLTSSDPKLNALGSKTSCPHRSGESKIQCLDLSCVCRTISGSGHYPLELHAALAETNLSISTEVREFDRASENMTCSVKNASDVSVKEKLEPMDEVLSGAATVSDGSEASSAAEPPKPEISVQTESCPKLITFSQQPADPVIETVEEEEQNKERTTVKANSTANMMTQATKSPESVKFASATNLNLSDKMMRIRQEQEHRGSSGEGEKKGKVITTDWVSAKPFQPQSPSVGCPTTDHSNNHFNNNNCHERCKIKGHVVSACGCSVSGRSFGYEFSMSDTFENSGEDNSQDDVVDIIVLPDAGEQPRIVGKSFPNHNSPPNYNYVQDNCRPPPPMFRPRPPHMPPHAFPMRPPHRYPAPCYPPHPPHPQSFPRPPPGFPHRPPLPRSSPGVRPFRVHGPGAIPYPPQLNIPPPPLPANCQNMAPPQPPVRVPSVNTGAPVTSSITSSQAPATSPSTSLQSKPGEKAAASPFDNLSPCFDKSGSSVVFSQNVPYQEIDGCCYFNPNYFPPDKPPPGLQYGYPQRGKRRKALRLSSRFPTQAGKFHHHANFYVKSCAEASIGGNYRDYED